MRGRIRSVKPESLLDEELWDLEQDSGLPIYRAFVGLWMYADREGRFEWRPRALKTCILPYWEGEFSRVLDALTSRAFVVRYAFESRELGVVRTLTRHQHINNKEPASILPAPPKELLEKSISLQRVRDALETRGQDTFTRHGWIGKGREGNGRGGEGEGRDADASLAPPPPVASPGAEPDVLGQLAAAWRQCTGQELDPDKFEPLLGELLDRAEREHETPQALFARAAQAFAANCSGRDQRPVLAWLVSQFGEWLATPINGAQKSPEALEFDAARAALAAAVKRGAPEAELEPLRDRVGRATRKVVDRDKHVS